MIELCAPVHYIDTKTSSGLPITIQARSWSDECPWSRQLPSQLLQLPVYRGTRMCRLCLETSQRPAIQARNTVVDPKLEIKYVGMAGLFHTAVALSP